MKRYVLLIVLFLFKIAVVQAQTAPTTAPTAPIARNASDVISIYGGGDNGNTYTNVAGINYNPYWGQATVESEVTIAGNKVLKYDNFGYQGTDWGGSHQNISTMQYLHVDIWTDTQAPRVFVISSGAEIPHAIPTVAGSWQSLDIPVTGITANLNDVYQFKFDNGSTGTIYLDNLYFWKAAAAPTGTDATLSDLKVAGTTVTGFSAGNTSYTVTLPFGTTTVPTVTAITNDASATKVITPAASLPGSTSVVVTSQDGTETKAYTLAFQVAPPNTECSGTDTVTQQGEALTAGYNYSFTTTGSGATASVTMTFELLDIKTGLIAYAWQQTPFAETEMTNVGGQKFSYTLTNQTVGSTITYACKFAYAANLTVTKYFTYTVGNTCITPDTQAPTNLTASVGAITSTSVELLLNGIDDSGLVTYTATYGGKTVTATGASGTQKSLIIYGLTPSTTYSFSITAKDATGNTAANSPIALSATTLVDTNTESSGTSSETSQGGPFTVGYTYSFTANASGDVTVTFELLDTDKTGVVASLWQQTPFADLGEMTNVSGLKFTKIITGQNIGSTISFACKFAYAAGGLIVTKYFTYTVNNTSPVFTPVAPICYGGTLNPLPTTSDNGITGTWSPALDNTKTTVYTFTPNPGQNAAITTITITVNNSTTPTFANISPICAGVTLSPLPTTSTNGITGVWSPDVNNKTTTTYMFTPDSGQCAIPTTVTIVVNPSTNPTFNDIPSINKGALLSALPTTSLEGINGTWTPSLNNNATTTYTFTPTPSTACVNSTTLTIVVIEPTQSPGFSDPNATSGDTTSSTSYYHDTQGKLEISNSGQAVYTLPIAMPPSIQNVGPTINLVYASGQQGGIAGQGWNINSISNISRMSTRQDIDGFRDGVDFDDNDKLALDGQRLLLKSGTYWADGSQYETEVQSNTKIELKGSGTNMYFIVTTPDGSRSWYGNYGGMNATDITAYYIVRFEDANGNSINYNYNKPLSKSLCISEIQFSANTHTNPSPLNKIKFFYTQAARTEYGYIKGIKLERSELLNEVIVYTNGKVFRDYQLKHATDGFGYQRVQKIQEFNGAGEPANPVIFKYDSTTSTNVNSETTKSYNNNIAFNNSQISGDFDGDGRLDFVADNNLYTKVFDGSAGNNPLSIPFSNTSNSTVTSRQLFAATTLLGSKLNQAQSIVRAREEQNWISFEIYNKIPSGSPYIEGVSMDNIKTIDFDNNTFHQTNLDTQITKNYNSIDEVLTQDIIQNCVNPTIKESNEYLEGDFNGDGISEVLITNRINERYYYVNTTDYTSIPNYESVYNEEYDYWSLQPVYHFIRSCEVKIVDDGEEFHLLNLDPNASTQLGSSGFVKLQNATVLEGKRVVVDMNSDGKADIFVINNDSSYKIISFNQLTAAPWVEIQVIGQGTIPNYNNTKQILFGDYNGDGKTDLMLPEGDGGEGQSNWVVYYSNPKLNGGDMFEKQTFNITEYWPSNRYPSGQTYINNFYAMDVNKDGKSDLVRFETRLYRPNEIFDGKNWDSQWTLKTFINNIGNVSNSGFTADYVNPCYDYGLFKDCGHNEGSSWRPIPISGSYRNNGLNSDFVVVREHNNTITYTNFNRDFNQDNLLKKIIESNGAITDEIEYKTMESINNNGLGTSTDFYSSNNSVDYPFIELKQISNNKLVSILKNTSSGITKKQDFKYQGFTVNLGGLGVIGFKKTARSSWYKDSDKKIWSVTENNPLQRGATVRTYSQLLDSSTPFAFLTSYTTGLLSKTETAFNVLSPPNTFPYSILLSTQTATDFLTNIVKKQEYLEYTTDYLLPKRVKSSNYLGTVLHGSTETVTSYDSMVSGTGSSYYIGRPKEVNTTSTVNVNTPIAGTPDIKTSNEKYFYTNGNLTKKEKNANNSAETIVESFAYFPNGLLQSKSISATGTAEASALDTRSTSYTYDPSNRFVYETTDVELLKTTNLIYDPIYGLVKSQENPFGQTTTSEYDNWGKPKKVTDFLGKSITYTYSRANNVYTTTQVGDDGSSSLIDNDALARPIRKGSIDLNGNWVYVSTEYDYLGRKLRDSEPYSSTDSPSQWTTYEYDNYSRPKKTTVYTGKIITTSYNGLTVSATDNVMSKTKIMNANGQVITAIDTPAGGTDQTITYTFDANGNLTESNYAGISTTMTYDNWGRKHSIKDSSAGLYSYTYNAFGETLTEETPKGLTTYTLNKVGKVLTKKIEGKTNVNGDTNDENTNITSTYTYDDTTKWLTNIDVDNKYDGKSTYEYTYDPDTKQLNKTVETLYPLGSTTAFATFTKELSFDAFGRVNTETSTAEAHNKTSSKIITHTYKNGVPWKLLDGTTEKWKINTVNARGQLTSATLGNGIKISNTYDDYGYATQNQHTLGSTPVMTLNTFFEPVLGNLYHRYNSLFDAKESFEYDFSDRLISWDGLATNLLTLPFDTTTDGFTFSGTTTKGSVSNSAGTLMVNLKEPSVSANKDLTINAITGDKFRIKADITSASGQAIVDAIIVETDPDDASKSFETFIGTVNNGTLDYDYTFGDNLTNAKLSLKFMIKGAFSRIVEGTPPPQKATFYVDNLKIDKIEVNTQNYDDRGRITDNAIGTYRYDTAHPYQNKEILTTPDASNYYTVNHLQNITYNAFKAPIQIEEQDADIISFGYNAMQQRNVMYYGNTDTNKLARPYRKYYSADGSMEVKATFAPGDTTTPTAVEFVTYVGGDAYSAPIVLKSDDGTTQNYFYLHRDYQGSILAITNETGNIIEKRLFDPWGSIEKIQDGAGNTLTQLKFFDRGYTGHEHLESVGLINMNARLYDPKLHRFLQPDNFVQDPSNTQNYNRYGYCVNNPLKYTDPTGNIFIVDDIIISAMIIGAIVGAGTYAIMVVTGHANLSFEGAFSAVIFGAISGAATAGIAQGFGAICNFTSTATGFWNGAAIGGSTGFVTGISGSALNSVMSGGSIKLGQLLTAGAIGAVVGGVMGGLGAGARAKEQGLDYWSGDGDIVSPITVTPGTSGGQQYRSNAEMRADYNVTIGAGDKVSLEQAEGMFKNTVSLATPTNLPEGAYLSSDGYITYPAMGNQPESVAGGVTSVKSGLFGYGRSSITRISPYIKGVSPYEKNMIFKHEFMHAWHWNSGMSSKFYKAYSERATSTFSLQYAKSFNLDNRLINQIRVNGMEAGGFVFPESMSWHEFNKIIPTWLK